MLADSIPLHQAQQEFEDDIIFDIARTVFGMTPESIAEDTAFVSTTFQAICDRFPGITTNDIGEAFLTHEPKEKVYVLSRKDFIEPIQRYWAKKMVVLRELSVINQQVESELKLEREAAEFKRQSIELYRECLNTCVWSGTEFQAHTFAAEMFSRAFDQSAKDVIWEESKLEFLQRKEAVNQNDPFALPPPPADKIFARRIVEEALKRKLQISY